MVFDGIELLEFAIKSIRQQVDYVSATYQSISYFGNPSDPDLYSILCKLKNNGLIDELIHYDTDLSIHHKQNELNLRNLGLNASKKAGCTHHISADVDEFYKSNELEYAKKVMDENNYDFSVVKYYTYYKYPTYLVTPVQNLLVSFIHPVDNEYNKDIKYPEFPYHMETTRRFAKTGKHILLDPNKIMMHHMSYVRKDIRKKFNNSDNAQFYKLKKFYKTFDNYQLGDRVCLLPDYMNRKTVEVENIFGINF